VANALLHEQVESMPQNSRLLGVFDPDFSWNPPVISTGTVTTQPALPAQNGRAIGSTGAAQP